jgi:hemerythrin-like domain-containing protein
MGASTALAILEREHRQIERVLGGLRRWIAFEATEDPDARGTLDRFVRFLREFADHAHHGKEEGVLFETLRRHGALPDCGPINLYLREHAEGREIVRGLASYVSRPGPISDDREEIEDLVQRLMALYGAHIAREDGELFPAISDVLSDDALADVDRRFADAAELVAGSRHYDRLVAEGESLAGPGPAENPNAT